MVASRISAFTTVSSAHNKYEMPSLIRESRLGMDVKNPAAVDAFGPKREPRAGSDAVALREKVLFRVD